MNHTILNLATRESCASHAFERISMFLEIAEGLMLRLKCRLETAHLANCADRQNESNGLSRALLGLGHDPDILGHSSAFSVRKRASDQHVPTEPFANGSLRQMH